MTNALELGESVEIVNAAGCAVSIHRLPPTPLTPNGDRCFAVVDGAIRSITCIRGRSTKSNDADALHDLAEQLDAIATALRDEAGRRLQSTTTAKETL